MANPQALNRYAYTLNNPLRYTDPTGHWVESALDIAFIVYDIHAIATGGLTAASGAALAADVAGTVIGCYPCRRSEGAGKGSQGERVLTPAPARSCDSYHTAAARSARRARRP